MSIPRCRCWCVAKYGHDLDCAENRELNRIADRLLARVAVGAPAQTIVLTDVDRQAIERASEAAR